MASGLRDKKAIYIERVSNGWALISYDPMTDDRNYVVHAVAETLERLLSLVGEWARVQLAATNKANPV